MGERKKKIMVVEDDNYVHELLEFALSGGYEIVSASEGMKALVMIEEEAPDLIFLDYMLPGISGVEIHRRIKESTKISNIPVVMMSASPRLKEVTEGLGVAYVMRKPFNMSEVLSVVEKLIK